MRMRRLCTWTIVWVLLTRPAAADRLVYQPDRDGPGEVFLALDAPAPAGRSADYVWKLLGPGERQIAKGEYRFEVPPGSAISSNRLRFADRPPGVYHLWYRPASPRSRVADVGLVTRGTAIRPRGSRPADFDDFWKRALFEARRRAGKIERRARPDLSDGRIEVSEIRFEGAAGGKLFAWYCRPAGRTVCPGLLLIHGYGGGWPQPPLDEARRGFAVLAPELRAHGRSRDPRYDGEEIILAGLPSREDHYFRKSFLDMVLAADALAELPGVDPARIAAAGSSLGGAHAIVCAALVPRLSAVAAAVPFLCDIRHACGDAVEGPYLKLAPRLAADRGQGAALDYFDVANFAPLVRCPARISVGLLDLTSPPDSVLAMYNALAGEKELAVYAEKGHGASVPDASPRIEWLVGRLGVGEGGADPPQKLK